MKYFIILLSLCFAINVNAKETNENNIIKVEATGVAKTLDDAINQALNNAVKQNSTIFVNKNSSSSKLEAEILGKTISGSVKEDNIKYNGKIKGYEVLSQEKKKDEYIVKILANIEKAPVKKEHKTESYTSPLSRKNYTPSLIVNSLNIKKPLKCFNNAINNNALATNFNNNVLNNIAEHKKFKILDRVEAETYANEASLIIAGMADKADRNKIAKIKIADYFLVTNLASLDVKDETQVLELTGESFFKAELNYAVNYKLIETATMEVVDFGSFKQSKEYKEDINCEDIAENAILEISDKITDSIMQNIFNIKNNNFIDTNVAETKTVENETAKNKQPTLLPQDKSNVVKLPFDK